MSKLGNLLVGALAKHRHVFTTNQDPRLPGAIRITERALIEGKTMSEAVALGMDHIEGKVLISA